MASVKAFASAGTWNLTGDIRSYLLCCFSNPSSSSKSEAKRQQQQQLGQSDTDAELARHLTDGETVGLTGAADTAELLDASQADDGINVADDDDDGKTDQHRSFDQLTSTLPPDAAAVCENQPLKASFDPGHSARPTEALAVTSAEVHCDAGFSLEDDVEHGPPSGDTQPMANGLSGCDHRPPTNDAVDSATDETTTTTTTTKEKEKGKEKVSSAAEDPATDFANSNNPDSDERLFDVSDLQDVSRCGRLHVTFEYSVKSQRLTVTIHEAMEIPNQERGGSTDTQVRLTLLPTKNNRHRTKVIRSNENPKYDETFQIKIPKDELNRCGLRLRLYGCQRMTRERMIGECVVRFVTLSLDRPSSQWLTLEPRSSLADTDRGGSLDRRSRSSSAASGSSQSMDLEGTSELLLSLSYNAVTGRLTVDVVQATNLKCTATNRAPDTYVRVTLMSSSGKELMRSNTSVRKMSPNPVYREKFMFQVVEAQLAEVSLMVSVYGKRSLKREELVGWFTLGYSNSGEDETLHWNDMRLSSGSPVERWHVLAEP